ncbi:hypothetical protein LPY66_11600 [Dehalobacter sp. DCM]|uniref:hypothetical protein n=1 Tax=Dehalobacter sp. DCM TaxID=2907827 RepID=UPI003082070D|nr:hypothetical protein LPY66_11600 [Dehalobacter sp. DCM]
MGKKPQKIVIISVASIIAFMLLGISSVYFFIYGGPPVKTSDIEDYGVFEDFKGYSNLYIFPTQMPESTRIDSYYYYQRDTLFDPTCQIYLEYSLSKADFDAEVSRLSKITEKFDHEHYKNSVNNIVYDTKHFKYPAYVTIFNYDPIILYEYALINEESHKIICIFVQGVGADDVKFDQKYLPDGFGDDKSSGGFSIYSVPMEYGGNSYNEIKKR